ncbi:hypothetical protein GVX81_03910 [[Haemophilus] felis]|uniref:Uncharacterized protein n=1 Tax=[Haemophilus] felis TaxID=123822 RepID=A0A1T0B191_9PAST|nr:hypothetical protein [[Haemophilus] felis]NBI41150.1 hypothetical protein [[Haemophilus] felis]NBI43497.1 hypothetical protein [[Haemophilus] felis]OOS03842.1 hypothetical protein B0188_05885 [[Haemophilus] felis]
MLREKVQVVAYANGVATVRFQAVTGCGACSARKNCGTTLLSNLTRKPDDYMFNVASLMPLKAGQWIEIGLPERSLLVSVCLLYVIPLLVLVLGTFFSDFWGLSEGLRLIFILLSTSLTFFVVHICSKRLHQRVSYQPILLRQL